MAKRTYGHAYNEKQGVVVTEEAAPRRSMKGLIPYDTATIKEGPLARLAERFRR